MPITSLLDEIRAANQAYMDVPRHDGDAWYILARKLEAACWRRDTLSRLLDVAEESGCPGEDLVEGLLALNLHLGEGDLECLRSGLDDALYGRVLAQQGERFPATPEHHLLAGPGVDLKIQANRDSPWPRAKWQKIPAFGEYLFQGDTIRFRGMELQSGDVILANVNLDGNMVYSALSDPKGVFTHSAVLVIFQEDGRRFPAVVETYEKGVRAVPLSVFLNARFLAHAEVYRHRDVRPEHGADLARAAEAMIRDTRGYNCISWDDDPSYLSCTSVGRFLLEAIGVDGVAPVSAIRHPRVKENLEKVDYGYFEPFFAPVDYLLNPRFHLVGVVDNNQAPRLIARELVEHRFRTGFEKVELDTSRLPLEAKVSHFALSQIRKQSVVGKVIGRAIGFNDVNLPKGPDRMMASLQPVEHQFARAVKKIIPAVESYLASHDAFALQDILADDAMQARVRQLLSPAWLEP